MTLSVSKQILPVYDKPMIYYPLSVLMLAGIREILIISTPRDCRCFASCWAMAVIGASNCPIKSTIPDGLAQAYILGADLSTISLRP